MYRLIVVVPLFLIASAASGWAADDTLLNRFLQAERFAKLYDFRRMIIELAAANSSVDQREAVARRVTNVDMAKIKAVFIATMTEVYTVDEIEACVEFYSTPAGKRIMSKLPTFDLAIAPAIAEETKRIS